MSKIRKGVITERFCDDSIVDGVVGYPNGLFYLATLVPGKYQNLFGVFVNTLVDAFSAVIVFFALSEFSDYNSELNKYLLVIVFYCNPLFFTYESRIQGLKSRALGEFFFLITFLILLNDFSLLFKIIISIPLIFLLFFFSQFAVQVYLVSALGLVLFKQYAPLGALVVVSLLDFILKFVFDFSIINRVLLSRYHHTRWYIKQYRQGFLTFKNSFQSLYKSIIELNLKKICDDVFYNNSFILVVISLLPLVVLFPDTVDLRTEQNLDFIFLVTILIFSFFLFSFGVFKVWGSSERYVRYAMPFLLLSFTFKNLNVESVVISLSFSFIIIAIMYLHLNFNNILSALKSDNIIKKVSNVVEYLDKLDVHSNIYAIHPMTSYLLSSQVCNNKVKFLYPFILRTKDGFDYMNSILPNYSLPEINLEALAEYNIHLVVVDIQSYPNIAEYSKLKFKLDFADSNYIVLRINE